MGKYLKMYQLSGSAVSDETIISPNVSYISEDGGKVLMMDTGTDGDELQITGSSVSDLTIYKKETSTRDYLTFTCIEAGEFKIYNDFVRSSYSGPEFPTNIEYQLNGGSWTEIIDYPGYAGATWSLNMSAGDVIKFKGVNPDGLSMGFEDGYYYVQFQLTEGKFAGSGNIMSLIDGKKDGTKVIPPMKMIEYGGYTHGTCAFLQMFNNCTALTTAPELPATTLATMCYQEMFENCTSLTKAPELPATTLVSWCYQEMFHGCTNLEYVKCLATDMSAESCTSSWLSGVNGHGLFVKNANATWTTGSASGVPSGWALIDETDGGVLMLNNDTESEGVITVDIDNLGLNTLYYSTNGYTWGVCRTGGRFCETIEIRQNSMRCYKLTSEGETKVTFIANIGSPVISSHKNFNFYSECEGLGVLTFSSSSSDDYMYFDDEEGTSSAVLEWSTNKENWETITSEESMEGVMTFEETDTIYIRPSESYVPTSKIIFYVSEGVSLSSGVFNYEYSVELDE